MMVLIRCLTILSLLLLLLSSGCALLRKPEKEIIVKTVEVEKQIPIQGHPRSLKLGKVTWKVVTSQNIDELVKQYEEKNGPDWVFYVMEVESFERLALNMEDIKRYIQQQKQIIIYYEEAVKPKEKTDGKIP